MKTSVILSTAVKYLIPLLLIFSFFLFLRGHNEPGGGFVGGLVAASAFALFAIANGFDEAKKFMKIEPIMLIALGLLIALLSGLVPMFFGLDFLTGIWFEKNFPIIGKLGTPLVFDIGVYLVVLGISTKIIFSLAEEEK
ncbi:MAG: Na+/H+ antiporter subunit B [Melioribacteraceae bacterium]|nr:Na+/H+ antiporter subunit B [Melioribacteraceae bacterium]MCO6473837.1 Na+/H+ antiporter subunit B [Melioribacteraceae bacterium]MDD3559580.1 Na+/H+ antiporter subunit B [Melioribacteraceae bacterium]